MPLFSLPLAPHTRTHHAETKTARVKFSNLPVRKRKRPRQTEESSDDEDSSLDDDAGAPTATNPLSLAPLEIAQYRLAGLELDQDLPDVKGFPHKALPQGFGSRDKRGKGRGRGVAAETDINEGKNEAEQEQEEETAERMSRGPGLRIQHLSVLTTMLHRCLGEGDIKRASRAWAMLLRMQISGHGIDIRSNGYWEIGAALLIRSRDKKEKYSYEDEEIDIEDEPDIEEDVGLEKRWGSREGLELAKSFYERLILEFPYNRQFQKSVSAVDFWPAMVGCEIYGVQIEQKEGLRKVERREEKDEEEDGSGSESLDSDDVEEDPEEDNFTVNQRRNEKVRQRRAENRWAERDEVRQIALEAAQTIASKLDEVMTIPPYSDSHNMLRIRGMLALYIGDLSVPALPIERDESSDESEASRGRNRQGELDKNTERRFLYRQRVAEHDRGQATRSVERERALKMFDRIIRDGGEDEDIRELCLGMNGQEEEDDREGV